MSKHIANAAYENLKAGDVLTVYHGTSQDMCKRFLEYGIDGTRVVSRIHNQGRERGLYVTPDKKTADDFGSWVLEFRVRAKDLYPTARWGIGSQRKHVPADSSLLSPYKNSFRPIVSFQMNETAEPQAMFIGYAPTKSIVAVHKRKLDNTRITFTVDEAISFLDIATDRVKWDLSWSGKDIVDSITNKHDLAPGELLDILFDYDIDVFADEQRMPRKLKLRLAEYVNQQTRKKGSMSLAKTAKVLASFGIRSRIVVATNTAPYSPLMDIVDDLARKTKDKMTRWYDVLPEALDKAKKIVYELRESEIASHDINSIDKATVVNKLNVIENALFTLKHKPRSRSEMKFARFVLGLHKYGTETIKMVQESETLGDFAKAVYQTLGGLNLHYRQWMEYNDD